MFHERPGFGGQIHWIVKTMVSRVAAASDRWSRVLIPSPWCMDGLVRNAGAGLKGPGRAGLEKIIAEAMLANKRAEAAAKHARDLLRQVAELERKAAHHSPAKKPRAKANGAAKPKAKVAAKAKVKAKAKAKDAVKVKAAKKKRAYLRVVRVKEKGARKKRENPAAYVVMATVSRQPEDEVEARENGVDGFIQKPFDKKRIVGYIDHYLATHPGAS